MPHEVIFSPEAEEDLLRLYDDLAASAGPEIAFRYAERLRVYCQSFSTFPERGTRRDDLRPGLRVVGYKRRIAIAFHVGNKRVVIDRLLYGGRDLDWIFIEHTDD